MFIEDFQFNKADIDSFRQKRLSNSGDELINEAGAESIVQTKNDMSSFG